MSADDDDVPKKKKKSTKVGYKSPPPEHQFKKGKSGNVNGRPKGSKGFKATALKRFLAPLRIRENGKTKTVPGIDALLLRLHQKALSGDDKSIRQVLAYLREFDDADSAAAQQQPLTENDCKILREYEERLREQLIQQLNLAGWRPPEDGAGE